MQIAAGAVRLFARRSRPAAPRDGQEDQVGDGRPARPLRLRRAGARRRPRRRPTRSSTCWRKFADYGFNKSHAAAYALIAYQTAWFKANYPVEFLAASMTLDKSQHRQARRIPRRGAAARHQGRAAVDQRLRRRLRRARTCRGRAGDRLCAERDQGRRRRPGGGAGRSARRRGRSPRSPIWRGASTRAPSTSRRSKASPPPAPSTNWSPTAPRLRRDRADAGRSPTAPPTSARPARAGCSAKPRPRRRSRPRAEPWSAAERLQARIRGGRLLPLRPSARRLRRRR